MDQIAFAILTGVLATVLFETLKFFFSRARDVIARKSLPFSLEGYWRTYHEEFDPQKETLFSACELVHFTLRNDAVHMKLYQTTNDGRCHFYQGIGYVRGHKLVLSYYEADNDKSNFTGVFLLRESNANEHMISLVGSYGEFRRDDPQAKFFPYSLHPCQLPRKEQLRIALRGKKYAYSLMRGEGFRHEQSPAL